MRTTITLDDHLLARLKKRASDSGTSVSGLIERAVRLLLQTPAPTRNDEHFELVTFGKGEHFTRFNIDKTSALLEDDDVERFAKHR
jgi:hypothetical protein